MYSTIRWGWRLCSAVGLESNLGSMAGKECRLGSALPLLQHVLRIVLLKSRSWQARRGQLGGKGISVIISTISKFLKINRSKKNKQK